MKIDGRIVRCYLQYHRRHNAKKRVEFQAKIDNLENVIFEIVINRDRYVGLWIGARTLDCNFIGRESTV